MGRRTKQTTCFDDSTTSWIKSRLRSMAQTHNRLLMRGVLSRLTVDEASLMFVPEADRAALIDVHQRFRNYLASAAYALGFSGLGYEDLRVVFDWNNDLCKSNSNCFIVGPEHKGQALSSIARTPFGAELQQAIYEWVENGVKWGLALEVFEYINDIVVSPRHYSYMFFLLPTLRAILSKQDDKWNEVAKYTGRMTLPATRLEGLQKTNTFLAGALMLPVGGVDPIDSSIIVSFPSCPRIEKEIWPDSFYPIMLI